MIKYLLLFLLNNSQYYVSIDYSHCGYYDDDDYDKSVQYDEIRCNIILADIVVD